MAPQNRILRWRSWDSGLGDHGVLFSLVVCLAQLISVLPWMPSKFPSWFSSDLEKKIVDNLVLRNFACVYDTVVGGFMPSLMEEASTWNRSVFSEVFVVNSVANLDFLRANWELEKYTLSLLIGVSYSFWIYFSSRPGRFLLPYSVFSVSPLCELFCGLRGFGVWTVHEIERTIPCP
jgi:hypothetical protein